MNLTIQSKACDTFINVVAVGKNYLGVVHAELTELDPLTVFYVERTDLYHHTGFLRAHSQCATPAVSVAIRCGSGFPALTLCRNTLARVPFFEVASRQSSVQTTD